MRRYHIDTDMGVDDGLALMLADRVLDHVQAISTVFGNVAVETATRNARIFRALLGRTRDWTILMGASRAADGFFRDATHVHGADGMGGATQGLDPALLSGIAAEDTIALANAPPPAGGQVTLIGLGPATNIPELAAWYGKAAIERIVLMSGVFFDTGNITPYAEFNAYCDPASLRATLDLDIPVTLVPLDICRKVLLPRATVAAFGDARGDALARLISGSHEKYMEFYRDREAIDGCFPHDSIAILAALAPDRFYGLHGDVLVNGSSSARGHTRFAANPDSQVEICTGGDLKWIRQTLGKLLA